jgi:pimeloyl-ACP methyl ester carboxylesterase
MPDAPLTSFARSLMRVLYLHGFASSANSSKARLFSERLAAHGVRVEAPDFNLPSFETLTISRMIDQTLALLGADGSTERERVALIGSSLGAFVAVHVADRSHRVPIDRLVLLAPALDFASRGMRDLAGERVEQWRREGHLNVFHFAYGRTLPVGYALYEDAGRYDAFSLRLEMPVLIFQGTRDTVVDPDVAARFGRGRPNVTVRLLDDDHQLLGSFEQIWDETREFLQIPPTA